MKLLIALKSCIRDLEQGFHQTIRETWAKDFGSQADVRFFVGLGDKNGFVGFQPDEIELLCGDGYDDLPRKTQEICRWSVSEGYDFSFLLDNDTYVIPDLLLKVRFREYDYAGMFGEHPPIGTIFHYRDCHEIEHPECHPWSSGGCGYWLSKKAAKIIADAEVTSWAEDLWVGQVLGPHIIAEKLHAIDLKDFECHCTWHVKRLSVFEHKFYPEMIREIYRLGRPELWYKEVAADEYAALELIAKSPKTRVLPNKELQDRIKSAEAFRKRKR